MLTLNDLVNRVRRRLPNPVFQAIIAAEPKFFEEILEEETLPTWSMYYKKLIKGISVRRQHMLPVEDDRGMVSTNTKYILPLCDGEKPYLQIAQVMHPYNYIGPGIYTGVSPGLVDSLVAKVTSSIQMVNVRYSFTFEAPNIIVMNPAPRTHMDFTVNMYQMLGLDEIPNGYSSHVKKLYECDCKIALYYKFFNVADGGSYGGVELKDYVGDFKDYESTRDELIEELEADWYKDPTVFAEFFGTQEGII